MKLPAISYQLSAHAQMRPPWRALTLPVSGVAVAEGLQKFPAIGEMEG